MPDFTEQFEKATISYTTTPSRLAEKTISNMHYLIMRDKAETVYSEDRLAYEPKIAGELNRAYKDQSLVVKMRLSAFSNPYQIETVFEKLEELNEHNNNALNEDSRSVAIKLLEFKHLISDRYRVSKYSTSPKTIRNLGTYLNTYVLANEDNPAYALDRYIRSILPNDLSMSQMAAMFKPINELFEEINKLIGIGTIAHKPLICNFESIKLESAFTNLTKALSDRDISPMLNYISCLNPHVDSYKMDTPVVPRDLCIDENFIKMIKWESENGSTIQSASDVDVLLPASKRYLSALHKHQITDSVFKFNGRTALVYDVEEVDSAEVEAAAKKIRNSITTGVTAYKIKGGVWFPDIRIYTGDRYYYSANIRRLRRCRESTCEKVRFKSTPQTEGITDGYMLVLENHSTEPTVVLSTTIGRAMSSAFRKTTQAVIGELELSF